MGFRDQTADRAKGSVPAADERANSPMSILDPTQITLMRAISGATLRNTVLSNNIANADTPGFQPSDVNFHAALANAVEDEPEATADVTFAPEELSTGAQRADGNGVDSEAEAAKLAENGLEMEALEQVANSRVQIMKMAMGMNG
jgi:flagellar basal-body rod protein FlgB